MHSSILPQESNKTNYGLSLASGSLLMIVSTAAAGVLSLILSTLVARSVSVEDFGVYSILMSLQSFVAVFSGFALGYAVTKYVSQFLAQNRETAVDYAKTAFLVDCIFIGASCGAYVLLADLIGNNLYHSPEVVELIPYSALVVASTTILAMSMGIAQGCQRMKLVAVVRILAAAASVVAAYALIRTQGLRGVLIGLFLAQLAVAVVLIKDLNRKGFPFASLPIRLDRERIRTLLAYAVPATLSALVVAPIVWLSNTELTLQSGFQGMGHFSVSLVFFNGLASIPLSISVILMPKISQMSALAPNKMSVLLSDTIDSLSGLIFPLFLGIGLFSHEIIRIVFGNAYYPSDLPTYLMVVASYPFAIYSIFATLLYGTGKMWYGFALSAIWSVVFLTLTFAFVPILGPSGLAASYAMSYSIQVVVFLSMSPGKFNISLRRQYPAFVFSALFFAIGLAAVGPDGWSWWQRLLILVLGALLYSRVQEPHRGLVIARHFSDTIHRLIKR